MSDLYLTLGDLTIALDYAVKSVKFSDESGDLSDKFVCRATLANILHQSGCQKEAYNYFKDAEQLQNLYEPQEKYLYSLRGFNFCDLIISPQEINSWKAILDIHDDSSSSECQFDIVTKRIEQSIKISKLNSWLLSFSYDSLMLGRSLLFKTIIDQTFYKNPRSDYSSIDNAVANFHSSNKVDSLCKGLLTRSIYRFLANQKTGPDSAYEDLEEAWDIAHPSGMRLHETDILLTRARLFFREETYPWKNSSPQKDLLAAEALINQTGYHRRDQELADAKQAILKT